MKTCPNPDCPDRKKHGVAGEYRDDVDTCPSCGQALSGRAGAPPVGAAAVPAVGAAPDRGPDRRLVFTALAVVGAVVLSIVWLPGARDVHGVEDAGAGLAGLFTLAPEFLSWAALGVQPFLTAFVVVEVVALVVPALRARRLAGAAARRPLTVAALWLGLALLLVQAGTQAIWFLTLRPVDAYAAVHESPRAVLFGVSLIVGSGVLLWLANVVARRGYGNGLAVVVGAGLLWNLADWAYYGVMAIQSGEVAPARAAVIAAGAGALVWLTLRYVGDADRERALPRPASGIVPVVWAVSLLTVPATLQSLFEFESELVSQLVPGTLLYAGAHLVLAGLLTPFCLWLFARDALIGSARERFGVTAAREDVGVGSLRFSVGSNLALAGLGVLAAWAGLFFPVITVVVLTAIAKDLAGEARFGREHGALASAGSLQRLYLVEPALSVLEDEGIPAHPRALSHRTLWQFFAPWLPVELLVPVEHEARARALLDERMGA